MIKRQHIFDDILGSGSETYHSAILTCYSFDPLFFSSFYQPQLNSRGIRNQIVLIDSNRLDEAMEEEESYSFANGVSVFDGYTPLRINCKNGGVFHPKIMFFVGEKKITAIVGSGNLTYGGIAYNNEAWGAVCASSHDSPEARIVKDVWNYLNSIIARNHSASAEMQLSWMIDCSPALKSIVSHEYDDEADGNGIQFTKFIANGDSGKSIFDCISECTDEDQIKKISIVSAFYDTNGTALKNIIDVFNPEQLDCIIEESLEALPSNLDKSAFPQIKFYRMGGDLSEHLTHAKIIQLESDKRTILALGSANASIQALGFKGQFSNDEADFLVIDNGKRDYLAELGIELGPEIKEFMKESPSEHNLQDSSHKFKVEIFGCEVTENGGLIRVSHEMENVDLCLKDSFKRSTVIHFGHLDLEENFTFKGLEKPVKAYLSIDGVIISNKCPVVIKSDVERKNPDKAQAPISQLIANSASAKDFAELLQYVHIEEEMKTTSISARNTTNSNRPDLGNEPRQISDKDYEDRIFRHHRASIEQVNDRILEKIAAAAFSVGDDGSFDEHPEDETVSPDDRDVGNVKSSNSIEVKSEEKIAEMTVMDEARGYFKRLLNFYNLICKDFDSSDGVGILVPRPKYIREKTDLDYSAACIAVFEMCKVARNGSKKEQNELFYYFLQIVGRFLAIFKDIPKDIEKDSPLYIKLQKKHRHLVVYSLLLASFYETFGKQERLMRLMILNLLDSYKNEQEGLDSAIDEYRDKLSLGLLPSNNKASSLVEKCILEYRAFITNIEAHRTMTKGWEYAIMYRPSFGFVYINNVVRHTYFKEALPYHFSAQSPAFKDFCIPDASHGEKMIIFETS